MVGKLDYGCPCGFVVLVGAFRKKKHGIFYPFRVDMPESPEFFVKDRGFEGCAHAEEVYCNLFEGIPDSRTFHGLCGVGKGFFGGFSFRDPPSEHEEGV